MSPLILIGAVLMTSALVLYSIGIITLLVRGRVRRSNVIMLACASCCDISGTILMIVTAGSFLPNGWHGVFGYCALGLMLVNLVLVFFYLSRDKMPTKMKVFDICVYIIWLCSYFMGATIH